MSNCSQDSATSKYGKPEVPPPHIITCVSSRSISMPCSSLSVSQVIFVFMFSAQSFSFICAVRQALMIFLESVSLMTFCCRVLYIYVRITNEMHTFSHYFIPIKQSSTCFEQIIVHHQEVISVHAAYSIFTMLKLY